MQRVGQVFLTVVVLLLFLISLELISSAGRHLGSDLSEAILRITGNPFVSLCLGLLATALIQSSSTLTASIVALTGANLLTIEAAIPMVLGANIGTSLTAIVVSLGYLGRPKAFRRSFYVGSSHVVFNVLSALLFFPLEVQFHFLSRSSTFLVPYLSNWGAIGMGWFAFYDFLVTPVAGLAQSMVSAQPVLILCFSLVLLFMSIYALTTIFRYWLLGNPHSQAFLKIFNKPGLSLMAGIGTTAAVHSSSVSTSLSVMLAATEKISPKRLFPFILGANVGTTVTALMAAIGRTDAAISIALCHLIFNLLGLILFFFIAPLRKLNLAIARWSAYRAQKNLTFAFGYLILLFFALPFLVIFLFEKF